MMKKPNKRTLVDSFGDAFTGIWDCIKMERNMRIHVTAVTVVSVTGILMRISRDDWALLTLSIALVISSEMLNTAIEKLCDFNQAKFSARIKVIKDISAGAVLVAAFCAVGIGISVFAKPKLITLIQMIFFTPQYLAIGLLFCIAAWFFIFWGPVKLKEKIFRNVNDKSR